LEAVQPSNPDSLPALLALDVQTRAVAQELARRFE
jgi:1-deoxy-D-xylulose-5-phosphate reductoisomerase